MEWISFKEKSKKTLRLFYQHNQTAQGFVLVQREFGHAQWYTGFPDCHAGMTVMIFYRSSIHNSIDWWEKKLRHLVPIRQNRLSCRIYCSECGWPGYSHSYFCIYDDQPGNYIFWMRSAKVQNYTLQVYRFWLRYDNLNQKIDKHHRPILLIHYLFHGLLKQQQKFYYGG